MKNKQQFKDHLAHLAAEYVSRESNRTSLITVTRAEINDKMTVCTLYFTVFPEAEEPNASIFMKRCAGGIRGYMRDTGGVMRVPHIETELDVGEKHRQRIEQLSQSLPK